MAELHPALHGGLMNIRKEGRDSSSRDKLPNFDVGDYILLARAYLFAGEKLSLCWRGPPLIVKTSNDCIFTTEYLCKDAHVNIKEFRLKFYRDSEMHSHVVMSNLLKF